MDRCPQANTPQCHYCSGCTITKDYICEACKWQECADKGQGVPECPKGHGPMKELS